MAGGSTSKPSPSLHRSELSVLATGPKLVVIWSVYPLINFPVEHSARGGLLPRVLGGVGEVVLQKAWPSTTLTMVMAMRAGCPDGGDESK